MAMHHHESDLFECSLMRFLSRAADVLIGFLALCCSNHLLSLDSVFMMSDVVTLGRFWLEKDHVVMNCCCTSAAHLRLLAHKVRSCQLHFRLRQTEDVSSKQLP